MAQAANNFVRGETAAAGLAAVQAIINALGSGWCFLLFAGLGVTFLSPLWLLETRGLRWRQKRAGRYVDGGAESRDVTPCIKTEMPAVREVASSCKVEHEIKSPV